jgi:hypothetical protein
VYYYAVGILFCGGENGISEQSSMWRDLHLYSSVPFSMHREGVISNHGGHSSAATITCFPLGC